MHISLAHLVVVLKGTPGVGAGACKLGDGARLLAEDEAMMGVEGVATVEVEAGARGMGLPGSRADGMCFGKALSTSLS
jgi:hypothetical protein